MNNNPNNQRDDLTLDQKAKLEKLRYFLPQLHSLLLERSRVLPIVASLSIALLIVFSFNKELIPITGGELKILITVLLLAVPASLLAHLGDNHLGIEHTYNSIKEVIGKDPLENRSIGKKTLDIVIAYLSWFSVSLITLVIIYIIYTIWW